MVTVGMCTLRWPPIEIGAREGAWPRRGALPWLVLRWRSLWLGALL